MSHDDERVLYQVYSDLYMWSANIADDRMASELITGGVILSAMMTAIVTVRDATILLWSLGIIGFLLTLFWHLLAFRALDHVGIYGGMASQLMVRLQDRAQFKDERRIKRSLALRTQTRIWYYCTTTILLVANASIPIAYTFQRPIFP